MATHEYTSYDRISRAARRQELRRRRRLRLGAAAAIVTVPALLGAHALSTRGTVMPGTAVAGVDVGGLSPEAARARIVHELGARLSSPLTVRVGDTTAEVVPAELGITLDERSTANAAFAADRIEARLLPFVSSAQIDPVLGYPKRLKLPKALARLEQKPRNARPVVQSDGRVAVVPAEDGLRYDDAAALRAIGAAAMAGDQIVVLAPVVSKPSIPTPAAEATADQARTLLAKPIAVAYKGKRLGRLDRRELAPLVRVRRVGSGYGLILAPKGLARALEGDTRRISRAPVDATWRTDGRRARLVRHRNGRGVDGERTAQAIVAAVLGEGTRRAEVVLGSVEPRRTTAEAKALGIREKISSVTTDLGASSPNRVYNVQLMARILDKQVIAPGQTFSFNKRVGPRTPDRGFREGHAIVGGLLLPSIGGGVCQVATTVFDAAFYAGLPISQRHNHAWYISHYAKGMDATVADGGPDLVFKNDTKHGILIRASATATTMTVTMYSTDRGVRVEKREGEAHAFSDPKPRYILNPALEGDQKVQRTAGQRGFAITVERIVRRKGKVVRQDAFTSNYVPESIVYIVGRQFVPSDGGVVENAPPEFKF